MRVARFIRDLGLALSAAALLASQPAAAQDWTDIWYSPAESGWGVNVVQSGNFMFVTFFIFGQDKKPTWYTAELTWNGTSFTGPLYLSTGSWYASQWNPGDVTRPPTRVGTATFQPSAINAYEATLTYTVDNVGTIIKPIERQTLAAIDLRGSYVGGQSGTYGNCSSSGSYIDTFTLQVAQTVANVLTLSFHYDSGSDCTLSGTFERRGLYFRVPGARYVCTGLMPVDTTATVYEVKQTGQGVEGRFSAANAGGCQEDAAFSAALQ